MNQVQNAERRTQNLLLQDFSAEAQRPRSDAGTGSQWVPWECVCGKRCGAYLHHYQLVSCSRCQALWWALQPRRGGRLAAFAWPGFPQSL